MPPFFIYKTPVFILVKTNTAILDRKKSRSLPRLCTGTSLRELLGGASRNGKVILHASYYQFIPNRFVIEIIR
ncbi:hypothetical protein NUBL21997_47620 [Klebsiella pneumoniae]|nr:hypothetical protein NUBL21997_47620 [Klebsiella pneumoniae]